jgi:hypothetical protein
MQCLNCPVFNPSILRHNGIWGAADDAVLNKERIIQAEIADIRRPET